MDIERQQKIEVKLEKRINFIVSEENMSLNLHKRSGCLISQCMQMPVQILNGLGLKSTCDPVSIQTGLLSVRQPNAILWRLDGGSIVADFVSLLVHDALL